MWTRNAVDKVSKNLAHLSLCKQPHTWPMTNIPIATPTPQSAPIMKPLPSQMLESMISRLSSLLQPMIKEVPHRHCCSPLGFWNKVD